MLALTPNVSVRRLEEILPKIHHHIDQPDSWRDVSRGLIVRGWCFSADGKSPQAIRLRVGDLCLPATIGLPRPDVKKAFSNAPGDNTGFEIRGVLPQGKIQLSIEAKFSGGTWQLVMGKSLQVRQSWLPDWISGDARELLFFQMPAHGIHPPRAIKAESFPSAAPTTPRPRFSIVTPSFQQALFLAETLDSVLQQKGVSGDYFVQDGGSTDGSPAIIMQCAQTHPLKQPPEEKSAKTIPLTRWESAPDGGQAAAIARGFAQSAGSPDDLMAWINSDDFYLPGALAFVAGYFAIHPEVDAIYGHRILVDEHSREIGRWFLPKHDPEVLRLNDFVPQETLFWRRRIWDKVGGVNKSFKFAMDWDLLLRFQAAGARIVRVPYFLACFRIHTAQKTSSAMHAIGQGEIDQLRARTYGRPFNPAELEKNPRLLTYLKRSAFIEFMWKRGIRLN